MQDGRGVNVIIPAGGVGARFAEAGYTTPKPLIKVLGEPMILQVLRSARPEDNVVIPYLALLDGHGFSRIIAQRYPNVVLLPIQRRTKGAAETVAQATPFLHDGPVVVMD